MEQRQVEYVIATAPRQVKKVYIVPTTGSPGSLSMTIISDREVYRYDRTHKWIGGGEMWNCERCGESKISIGMWGDTNWRSTHMGWKVPCQGFIDFWSKFDFEKELKGITNEA